MIQQIESLLLQILILLLPFSGSVLPLESATAPSTNSQTVSRVIDGDTVELSTGQKVRYIGIDTPEIRGDECFAVQAKEKNKSLALDELVRLEKDVSETDRYGRLLRYVYVDDQMIQEVLLQEGYAVASAYPPDVKHQQRFEALEREAREAERGLWGEGCVAGAATSNESPVPSQKCQYSCDSPDRDCSDFESHTEAQTFFECCGFSATNDPMRLDGRR